MDFELTEEQKMIQQMARDFAANEVKPKAQELDKTERHPAQIVQKLAELNMLGIAIPDTYGGGGADIVSYALALEEISWGCASVGVIMSVNNSLVCDPINTFGTEEQKKAVLDGIEKMASEIPGLKNVWLKGIKVQGAYQEKQPDGTFKNRPFTDAFVMEFENEAAFKAYDDAPAHRAWEKIYTTVRARSSTHDITN